MCKNLRSTTLKSVEVWKIVAEKNGKYYSVAIGFKYPKKGKVPIPKEQHRIGELFNTEILIDHNAGYSTEMVGKTTGFVEYAAATYLHYNLSNSGIKEGYTLAIKNVYLSGEIMVGKYGRSVVYAGSYTKFLE